MKITPLHDWNLDPRQAVELQKQLAYEVVAEDRFDAPIKTVAGIDLGYDAKNDTSRAVVVILNFPALDLIETSEALLPIQFPYVPGLLSFRETPVAIKALEKLTITPDLILCDGQGLAHPRRFGIACHIGLITDVPTLGVAKSLLVGKFDNLGETRGSTSPLIHRNEQVGVVLRTKDKVQPVYVSVGHRISLATATDFVLQCAPKYRLPETTRLADKMASYRKKMMTPENLQKMQRRREKAQRLSNRLLANIKQNKAEIEKLRDVFRQLEEDYVYRFYHQSFKVFGATTQIKQAIELFERLAPDSFPLNEWFRSMANEAIGKEFDFAETNQIWLKETRPILEAFWHSKYFLEQMLAAADELETSAQLLPSGWAAVLYLYNLR